MAASLACKVGLWALDKKRIRKKTHGRPAKSLFAFGLESLRKLFASRTFAQSLKIILIFFLGNPKKNKVLLCI